MNRRAFVKLAASGAGAMATWPMPVWAAAGDGTSKRRPNVVVFLTDDQGYCDLGFHGNPHVKTPHMDAFAREAVEFEQFHVCPVCAPTRASLMTGRYHFRTGVTDVFGKDYFMDAGEVTLAEALRSAGYATGLFGKWHLGEGAAGGPGTQGFDESLTFPGAAMRQYLNPTLIHNGVSKPFKGYCTDIFVDHAIEFIRKNRPKPFFLYLPTNLIHTPLQIDEEYAKPYRAQNLDDKTSRIYGMLKNVDDNLGRLRALLKELGLEDDTLMIFLSDNGPCSGSITPQRFMDGLHGLKGTVYENGIRVPCFVRWPGGFKGPEKVDRIAAHIDLMPTILDACGVPPPAGVKLDGVSLMPLLRNPKREWADRTLFFQWDSGSVPRRSHAFAVRNQRYKLVQPTGMDDSRQAHIRRRYEELCAAQGRGQRTIEGPPRYELYDMANDPGERTDIAGRHPDLVEKMKAQYERWFDDVCARWAKTPAPQ